jgi:hypothetical protein
VANQLKVRGNARTTDAKVFKDLSCYVNLLPIAVMR